MGSNTPPKQPDKSIRKQANVPLTGRENEDTDTTHNPSRTERTEDAPSRSNSRLSSGNPQDRRTKIRFLSDDDSQKKPEISKSEEYEPSVKGSSDPPQIRNSSDSKLNKTNECSTNEETSSSRDIISSRKTFSKDAAPRKAEKKLEFNYDFTKESSANIDPDTSKCCSIHSCNKVGTSMGLDSSNTTYFPFSSAGSQDARPRIAERSFESNKVSKKDLCAETPIIQSDSTESSVILDVSNESYSYIHVPSVGSEDVRLYEAERKSDFDYDSTKESSANIVPSISKRCSINSCQKQYTSEGPDSSNEIKSYFPFSCADSQNALPRTAETISKLNNDSTKEPTAKNIPSTSKCCSIHSSLKLCSSDGPDSSKETKSYFPSLNAGSQDDSPRTAEKSCESDSISRKDSSAKIVPAERTESDASKGLDLIKETKNYVPFSSAESKFVRLRTTEKKFEYDYISTNEQNAPEKIFEFNYDTSNELITRNVPGTSKCCSNPTCKKLRTNEGLGSINVTESYFPFSSAGGHNVQPGTAERLYELNNDSTKGPSAKNVPGTSKCCSMSWQSNKFETNKGLDSRKESKSNFSFSSANSQDARLHTTERSFRAKNFYSKEPGSNKVSCECKELGAIRGPGSTSSNESKSYFPLSSTTSQNFESINKSSKESSANNEPGIIECCPCKKLKTSKGQDSNKKSKSNFSLASADRQNAWPHTTDRIPKSKNFYTKKPGTKEVSCECKISDASKESKGYSRFLKTGGQYYDDKNVKLINKSSKELSANNEPGIIEWPSNKLETSKGQDLRKEPKSNFSVLSADSQDARSHKSDKSFVPKNVYRKTPSSKEDICECKISSHKIFEFNYDSTKELSANNVPGTSKCCSISCPCNKSETSKGLDLSKESKSKLSFSSADSQDAQRYTTDRSFESKNYYRKKPNTKENSCECKSSASKEPVPSSLSPGSSNETKRYSPVSSADSQDVQLRTAERKFEFNYDTMGANNVPGTSKCCSRPTCKKSGKRLDSSKESKSYFPFSSTGIEKSERSISHIRSRKKLTANKVLGASNEPYQKKKGKHFFPFSSAGRENARTQTSEKSVASNDDTKKVPSLFGRKFLLRSKIKESGENRESNSPKKWKSYFPFSSARNEDTRLSVETKNENNKNSKTKPSAIKLQSKSKESILSQKLNSWKKGKRSYPFLSSRSEDAQSNATEKSFSSNDDSEKEPSAKKLRVNSKDSNENRGPNASKKWKSFFPFSRRGTEDARLQTSNFKKERGANKALGENMESGARKGWFHTSKKGKRSYPFSSAGSEDTRPNAAEKTLASNDDYEPNAKKIRGKDKKSGENKEPSWRNKWKNYFSFPKVSNKDARPETTQKKFTIKEPNADKIRGEKQRSKDASKEPYSSALSQDPCAAERSFGPNTDPIAIPGNSKGFDASKEFGASKGPDSSKKWKNFYLLPHKGSQKSRSRTDRKFKFKKTTSANRISRENKASGTRKGPNLGKKWKKFLTRVRSRRRTANNKLESKEDYDKNSIHSKDSGASKGLGSSNETRRFFLFSRAGRKASSPRSDERGLQSEDDSRKKPRIFKFRGESKNSSARKGPNTSDQTKRSFPFFSFGRKEARTAEKSFASDEDSKKESSAKKLEGESKKLGKIKEPNSRHEAKKYFLRDARPRTDEKSFEPKDDSRKKPSANKYPRQDEEPGTSKGLDSSKKWKKFFPFSVASHDTRHRTSERNVESKNMFQKESSSNEVPSKTKETGVGKGVIIQDSREYLGDKWKSYIPFSSAGSQDDRPLVKSKSDSKKDSSANKVPTGSTISVLSKGPGSSNEPKSYFPFLIPFRSEGRQDEPIGSDGRSIESKKSLRKESSANRSSGLSKETTRSDRSTHETGSSSCCSTPVIRELVRQETNKAIRRLYGESTRDEKKRGSWSLIPVSFLPCLPFSGGVNSTYTDDTNTSSLVKTLVLVANTLIQLCIGATNMAIICYAFKTGNVHSGLCVVGYHFFMAEAILALNPGNAWTALFTMDQKRFVHLFLQLCGMIFALTGSIHVIVKNDFVVRYAHAVTGVIALCCGVMTFLLGPIALFNGIKSKTLHICVGIPTFGFAVASLILGVLKKEFKDWAGTANVVIIILVVLFHSILIAIMVFLRCARRIIISPNHI